MKLAILAGVTAVICLAAAPLQSQPKSSAPSGTSLTQASAERAQVVLRSALDAHGGVDALRAIVTVTRELAGDRTDVGQGGAPVSFERTADRIGTIPPTVNRSRTTSVRDLRQQRVAEHQRYEIYGGQRVSRRTSLGATEGFVTYFDYVYRGIRSTPASGLARAKTVAFRRYPESLLLTAWDRRDNVRWLGNATWEGRPHQVLTFADGDGTQVSLYVDDATHRLSKIETLGEDGILDDIVSEVVYDDYRTVGGVVLPFRYVDRRGGVVLDDNRASSIVLDLPASDTLFQRPAGIPEVDFGKPFPTVERLGDGVYAVMGGYNTVFVAFDDYVVVFEAGGSSREAETVIGRIKEVAPGKPIRYVVATHWNYDHLSGIRPYVAEGATIIAPPSAQPIIQSAVAAKRVLHPDALSRKPAAPKFEPLGGRQRTFTDGKRTIVVHDITPSPHANEMFIAYLPNERILFEADLLDIIVPGHAGTAGHDTKDLAAKIEKLGLNVERILPVHGQIGTIDELRQSLARPPQ